MASQGLWGRRLPSSGSLSSCPSQSCLRRRDHAHKDNRLGRRGPLDASLPAVHPNIVSNIESDCKTALQK